MTMLARLQKLAATVMAVAAILPGASTAQPGPDSSDWQRTKCEIYRQSWDKALGFFGSDNLNHSFIAQNENFIESGCAAPPSICAQSSQELDMANALTIAMMNAGAASTFLPFRCHDVGQARPTGDPARLSVEGQLCRAQLDLLERGNKLTQQEAAVFEAQCACLERNQGAQIDCAK
ncbi:hypothetical protein ABIB57_003477 [Devosia sp. UYZn731]|uniref:hypothetical protein n=1 Tax=Devosia sp. UYZn731 TaxID=3156345 RepID=UPI00339087A4